MDCLEIGVKKRMKTDVVAIRTTGEGIGQALWETERAAAYRGLDRKQTLRLRLLAEEMTGMLRTIIGASHLCYWVESEDNLFSLHLQGRARMNPDLREELLKTSTTGKNAAAKGFMGRLRDLFEQYCEADTMDPQAPFGYTYVDIVGFDASVDASPSMICGWSLNEYKAAAMAHKEEEPERWDELEKSITARLADEIKIYIRGNTVEIVIEKAF